MNAFHSVPRAAATVVVIREGAVLPEVFMLQRHSRAVFASHYVFPGGIVESVDSQVHGRASGVTAAQANAHLGIEKDGLDYYSAAIREAFEESGVLIARAADGSWALSAGQNKRAAMEAEREKLNNGTLGWAEFLDRHDFRPAYDALHYISYWVTPRVQRKRFSTRFFLAVIPQGQLAVHDAGELTDSCWMTAKQVLQAGRRGEMKLMHPTFATLQEIAQFETVAAVIAWAERRCRSGTAKLLPAFVEVDGRHQVVMPDSPHYPDDFDT